MKISDRVLKMEESVTLASDAKAKKQKAEGKDVLFLTLGQPDFHTPENIQDVAVEAIRDGRASFYTVASGLPALKAAVNTYFERYYGYSVSPNQVTFATGAKFSLYTFFMAVVDPGDEVLIPTPYWVSYGDQVLMAEGVPVYVKGTQVNNFKVTVEQLEEARTEKTKVLVLNSPSNPTGMIYSKEGQTTSNLTAVSQYATIEALTGPQDSVEVMRQAFEERLNTIYPLLCEVPGFDVIKPQGAFYLFPNVTKAMEMKGYSDVTEFATAILEEVGVALITGAGFGAPENVRLSYATDLETLKEAVRRLHQFMEN